MAKTEINTTYNNKWFIFFSKVRPWLVIIFGFKSYFDILNRVTHDITLWSLLFFLSVTLIHYFLCIMVFTLSSSKYNVFYNYVKKFLIFEVFSYSYQAGFRQYTTNPDYGYAFTTFFLGLLIFSLIWYLPNYIYFKKRVTNNS